MPPPKQTKIIHPHTQVLDDPEVAEHSKTFVAEVVADDSLQRTGGAAIWSSFQYSFQPKLVRVCSFIRLYPIHYIISVFIHIYVCSMSVLCLCVYLLNVGF